MRYRLIDAFEHYGQIMVWLRDGEKNVFAADKLEPEFFLTGPFADLVKFADSLCETKPKNEFAVRIVKKKDFETNERIDALSVKVFQLGKRREFIKLAEQTDLDLHNADIPFDQLYLNQNGLRPLQFVDVSIQKDKIMKIAPATFQTLNIEYPALKTAQIRTIADKNPLQSFEAPLIAVQLNEKYHRGNEKQLLDEFAKAYRELDPDIVLVEHGNQYTIEYLLERFKANKRTFNFGRFPDNGRRTGGDSYFSYGRVIRREPAHDFKGRIHIDSNSFHYREAGIEGVLEIAHSTGMPIQKAAFKTSGSCISNAQVYQAYQDGYLIPVKKTAVEKFHDAWHLFIVDKGGLILEPKIGLHEQVVELDFSSLYPSIMVHHNISPETVLCSCCPKNKIVPEANYHVCQKRDGLLRRVLRPLLERRLYYKKMKTLTEGKEKKRFTEQSNALKWLLVTSFGYTGYKNARFGRIEAHQSICAYAREKLLQAKETAEEMGFEIVHGYVDSLYVKKPGFRAEEMEELIQRITAKTGVEIVLEGIFNWLVFLPRTHNKDYAVPNRFYGTYQNGELKIRGLAMRRRDTPIAIAKMQARQLNELAKAKTFNEYKEIIPATIRILRENLVKLHHGEIPPEDLAITKTVSKPLEEYANWSTQKNILTQLKQQGLEIHPGQNINYIHHKTNSKHPTNRSHPTGNETPRIDVQKYDQLFQNATLELYSFMKTKAEIEEASQNIQQMHLTDYETKKETIQITS